MERKPFNAPDLHASRNRTPAINFLAYPNKDPYGFFAQMKTDHPDLQQFTNREIAGWLKAYMKLLAQQVIDNRKGVRLPGGLGAVIVGLNKPTGTTERCNIDYNASKQYGFVVAHYNWHTNGYIAKIYYYGNIPRHRLQFHHLIRFKPCRKLQRTVAAVMKNEGYKKYIFFTSSSVREMFRKRKLPKAYRMLLKQEAAMKQFLADYDEFRFD